MVQQIKPRPKGGFLNAQKRKDELKRCTPTRDGVVLSQGGQVVRFDGADPK